MALAADHVLEAVEAVPADVPADGHAGRHVDDHPRGGAGKDQRVVALAAVIGVVAGAVARDHLVVAVAGHDLVVAGTRRQGVVAALAHDHVVGAGAGVGVGASGPHPVFAGDHAGEVVGVEVGLLDAHEDQFVAAGQADLHLAAVVGDHRLQRLPIANVDAVGPEVDDVGARLEVGDGVQVDSGAGFDAECVVALSAGERVIAETAIQPVGTGVAGEGVVAVDVA